MLLLPQGIPSGCEYQLCRLVSKSRVTRSVCWDPAGEGEVAVRRRQLLSTLLPCRQGLPGMFLQGVVERKVFAGISLLSFLFCF